MKKLKEGENEAIQILESIGVELDETYYDDNSQSSMPDLRYKNGRFIEVTHTKHNNAAAKFQNRYFTPQNGETIEQMFDRHIVVERECSEAVERLMQFRYELDEYGELTADAKIRYKKDNDLVKRHLGYDRTEFDYDKKFSEFNCDRPSFHHSIDNILRRVSEKSEKHPSGNTDLFIFVTKDEFRLMRDYLTQISINVYSKSFVSGLFKSPFQVIYICPWDFIRQEYITNEPMVYQFYKDELELNWKIFNENNK